MGEYRKVHLPFDFTPREYQIPMMTARQRGYKREVYVLHRRAGKDLTAWNDTIIATQEKVGFYPYFFPTFAQAKKVIWDGMTKEGRRFLDYIPRNIIADGTKGTKKINSTEMKIEFRNGSLLQLIGTDNFEALKGTNCIGAVFSEYALQDPRAWEKVVEPILLENGGWAKFLYTPNGKNHGYYLWEYAKNHPEEWETMLLTIDQTRKEDGTPVMTLEQIDALRERGVDEELIQQEYYCFPPNTDIICLDGVKSIKDVVVENFVLTHSNRYRKVKGVSKRKYTGKLIQIKTIGNRKDIVCTPEHRIRVCNDGINNKWIEAKDLTLDDRVTFPKILKKKQKIISRDLATLIAWYIAEGSCGKNAIQYTLHEVEIEYHEEIERCAKNFGYTCSLTHNRINHTKTVCINSVELMEFLVKNCGSGAENKKIPFDLIAGHEALVYEILIDGDGHRMGSKDMYSTISKTLAYQMQLLAHQLGYGAGILINDAKEIVIQGRKVNCKISYNVNIYIKPENRNKYNYYYRHKYNITTPIQKINYINYDGYIYNLEVMYDNSYTANGRVVHNCSFTMGTAGSYYAKLMEKARQDDRIKKIPLDSSTAVHTFWDIGVSDFTSIIFAQILPGEYHVIDFYENHGEGIAHYAKILQDKGYVYGNHYGPHDLKARVFAADGKPQIQVAKEHGINFQIVPKLSFQDGIEATRNLINKTYFDEEKSKVLIKHLDNYSKNWNNTMKVWTKEPRRDEHTHAADAMRYMAISQKTSVVYDPKAQALTNEIDYEYLRRKCNKFSGLS